MIVYDLICEEGGHHFEGWFGSSQDFDDQQARGLVSCPHCGGGQVVKAVMAPRLTRKGNQQSDGARPRNALAEKAPPPSVPEAIEALPAEAKAALLALAKAQAEALKSSRWVGKTFAQDVRAMHYGDKEPEAVHGQASVEEARSLIEEGVAIAPVLFPLAAPDEIN